MKQNIFLFLKSMLIILVCALAAYAVLVILYMIPTDTIRLNIKNSSDRYVSGQTYPEWSEGYRYTAYDEYTDGVYILTNTIYPGKDDEKNAFINAALVPHMDFYDINNDIIYSLSEDEPKPDGFTYYYPRYWHGYLVFLKTLLCIMSLNSVRILNFLFQFIVMTFVLMLCVKKTGNVELAAILAFTLLFLDPISCGMNFQLAAVMNVTLLALLGVLLLADKPKAKEYAPMFFLAVGIAVVFMDFLTYPIVSLLVPLGAYFYLLTKDSKEDPEVGPLFVIKCCFFWGVGYVGMWFAKWIIASIVSTMAGIPENPIRESLKQIAFRSGYVEGNYSFAEVIKENFMILAIKPILIVAFLVAAVWIAVMAYKTKKGKAFVSVKKKELLTYLLMTLIPIAWYLGAKEHSYIHAVYTFRNLAGCIMGLMLIAVSIWKTKNNRETV